MNRKGQEWGMRLAAVGVILLIVLVAWFVIGGINSLWQGYKFNKEVGDYCKLSYEASEINQKIQYLQNCSDLLHAQDFQGYAAWWFYKPQNSMIESYKILDSLLVRAKDLEFMNTTSWEYQQGLQQVEDEIEYFVHGTEERSGVLSRFKTKWCYDHSIGKVWCF